MYSPQLLRVQHDEWLRYAEARRLIIQARAETRESRRPRQRRHPQRALFGSLGRRRPVSHA